MPTADALRAHLDAALEALAVDPGDAERRARAVSLLVRAEQELAAFSAAAALADPKQDEDALRAELRSRIRRLAEAEHLGLPAEALERIAGGEPAQ